MKKIIYAFIVIIVLIPIVQASAEEYLSEFNEDGQTCKIENNLYYIDVSNNIAIATLYSCCDTSGKCDEIFFDTQNKREFTKEDIIELYNALYVKSKIDTSQISPETFEIDSSNGMCEYFGFDVLTQESVNLATSNENKIARYVSKDARKYVKTAKSLGMATGAVTKFSPGTFVVGLACVGFSGKEEKIAKDIAECKQYFESVKNRNTYFGLNQQMTQCVNNVDIELKDYTESLLMQLKAPLDKAANTITGLVNWVLSDPINNPDIKLDIKESNYNTFKSTYDKISTFNHDLTDNYAPSKADNTVTLFNNKNQKINQDYNQLYTSYETAKDRLPSSFVTWLKNLFIEPNYDFSQAKASLENIDNNLRSMQNDIGYYKFNSAKTISGTIGLELETTTTIINEELNKQRGFGF